MAMNLQYTYAVIQLDTGLCIACSTRSFEVIHDSYILVPTLDDYVGKYYNRLGDQMWYLDAEFTQPWEEAPQW